MSFEDELEEACEVNDIEVEVAPKARAISDFKRIEDTILRKAGSQLESALRWDESPEDADEPPDAWVAELGEEEAWRRFRAAKAGQMNAKEAPVGLKVAQGIFATITKSNAVRGSGDRTLNVQVIQVPEVPKLSSRERYESLPVKDDE